MEIHRRYELKLCEMNRCLVWERKKHEKKFVSFVSRKQKKERKMKIDTLFR